MLGLRPLGHREDFDLARWQGPSSCRRNEGQFIPFYEIAPRHQGLEQYISRRTSDRLLAFQNDLRNSTEIPVTEPPPTHSVPHRTGHAAGSFLSP